MLQQLAGYRAHSVSFLLRNQQARLQLQHVGRMRKRCTPPGVHRFALDTMFQVPGSWKHRVLCPGHCLGYAATGSTYRLRQVGVVVLPILCMISLKASKRLLIMHDLFVHALQANVLQEQEAIVSQDKFHFCSTIVWLGAQGRDAVKQATGEA